MARYPDVSMSVIRRLPRYYRFLEELHEKGVERISSRELAEIIGVTASQIRQDLNCFGGFGQQGYGYNVENLYAKIGDILDLNHKRKTILLGAGNLGLALANHMRFEDRGFQLVGLFDNSPSKFGVKVGSLAVQDTATLEEFCKEHQPEVVVLTLPQQDAMEIVPKLVEWGIKGFWNFSHYDMSSDEFPEVAIENVHLGDSLMTLSFQVSELDGVEQ